MNKKFGLSLLSFFLCIINLAFANTTYEDLEIYQQTRSREFVETRIQTLLLKHQELNTYFKITESELRIYSSFQDKESDTPEFILQFGNEPLPVVEGQEPFSANANSELPLQGLRVALDPGHIGGDFARPEERYIHMKDNPDIQFDEGTLTYLTAVYLKNLLEEKGAEVLITKDGIGTAAGLSYIEWRERELENTIAAKVASITDAEKKMTTANWWKSEEANAAVIRLLFNPYDMKVRANKINNFNPHLTLMIHYNAGWTKKDGSFDLASPKNYNIAFIPGSFMKGELATQEDRTHFVRLLVSNNMDTSVAFSSVVLKEVSKSTGVVTVQSDADLDYVESQRTEAEIQKGTQLNYLRRACLPADVAGIYARNLGMTRLVEGPMCYLESLCQDNEQECLLLNEKSVEIDGVKTSPRVIQVARACYSAILEYVGLSEEER